METYEDEELWWKQHGRPHNDDEMKCYRLWYEFLKLSDKQKWSAEVERHFGDVSDEFDGWWTEHSYGCGVCPGPGKGSDELLSC